MNAGFPFRRSHKDICGLEQKTREELHSCRGTKMRQEDSSSIAFPCSAATATQVGTATKWKQQWGSRSPALSPPSHRCVLKECAETSPPFAQGRVDHFLADACARLRFAVVTCPTSNPSFAIFHTVRFRTTKHQEYRRGGCHKHKRTPDCTGLSLGVRSTIFPHRVLFPARCEHDVLLKRAGIGGTRLFDLCFASSLFKWRQLWR